jgi:hypothetical protein
MDPAVDCQADRGLRHLRGFRPRGCGPQYIAVQTLARIPFAYKRASAPLPGKRFARFVNSGAGKIELLFGSGLFQWRGRLTGFRHARNIVCIRTNTPGGD